MQLVYDYTIVNSLPEFDEAKDRIARRHDQLLELGDVICRYRLHEDVGLCLLHRHFDLADGERLVGVYDEDDYVVGVASRDDWTGVVPSVWRVEHAGADGWGYRPLEFADTAAGGARLGRRAARAMATPAFLADMALRLRDLELTDTVGIAVLDRLPGDLPPDATVYETSSHGRRTSTRSQIGKDSIPQGEEVTVTLWAFHAERVA
jgi:hypothetical protein